MKMRHVAVVVLFCLVLMVVTAAVAGSGAASQDKPLGVNDLYVDGKYVGVVYQQTRYSGDRGIWLYKDLDDLTHVVEVR